MPFFTLKQESPKWTYRMRSFDSFMVFNSTWTLKITILHELLHEHTSTYKNHFFDFKPIEWVSIFWLINWFWCCPKINSKLKFESKISIIIIVFTQSLTGAVEFGERVNIHWLVHDECCMSCSSHWYLQFPHALSLNFLIWNCFTWEHNGNKFNRRLHPMA